MKRKWLKQLVSLWGAPISVLFLLLLTLWTPYITEIRDPPLEGIFALVPAWLFAGTAVLGGLLLSFWSAIRLTHDPPSRGAVLWTILLTALFFIPIGFAAGLSLQESESAALLFVYSTWGLAVISPLLFGALAWAVMRDRAIRLPHHLTNLAICIPCVILSGWSILQLV